MKVNYDPEVDILRIILKEVPIEESGEENAGIILDFDQQGNVVGLEILNASQRIDNPQAIEYAISKATASF
jgi:uncharacterized protein YuzE